MGKRFVSVWFKNLHTDWFSTREPLLHSQPFVLSSPSHGKMLISSVNPHAEKLGIYCGMAVADARAIYPSLTVKDDIPGLSEKLLKKIGEWCIRFSPVVALDHPFGLIMDATGCSHLWGGDRAYAETIAKKLQNKGYRVQIGIADTSPVAWALARYGGERISIVQGELPEAFLSLPAEAMRLDPLTTEKLYTLGLRKIRDFIGLPAAALKRRFGSMIIDRINKAIGKEEEMIDPLKPVEQFEERLPCIDPIITGTGVENGLNILLQALCPKLKMAQKGVRKLIFRSYTTDGNTYELNIETTHASANENHLFRLFEIKLNTIVVHAGIELFTLTAAIVEELRIEQEKIWEGPASLSNIALSEFIDSISVRSGKSSVRRFLPAEQHIPERSYKIASSWLEEPTALWKTVPLRPILLLDPPEQIEVTAPIPDYPPMMFRYHGNLHKVIKADGPERIEQEWWVATGRHRDYYAVEDEQGKRYWLFRSGHYDAGKTYKWFIHGFFA